MTVFGCLPHKNDAKLPSVYRTVVGHKKSGDLLDNYMGHEYVLATRLLDCGQALCNGPLTEEICHDKGRARGSSGSHRAASQAPDGGGNHEVLADDYGCAAYRGECGIAGIWEI